MVVMWAVCIPPRRCNGLEAPTAKCVFSHSMDRRRGKASAGKCCTAAGCKNPGVITVLVKVTGGRSPGPARQARSRIILLIWFTYKLKMSCCQDLLLEITHD